MIKINLDGKLKKEIEQLLLKDAHSAPTGIFWVLKDPRVKKELQKKGCYPGIYDELYDQATGELAEERVKKLLLADRKDLEQYIVKLGRYDPKKRREKDASQYLLDRVFQYKTYANRKVVCEILRKMDVPVCPYCNRQFIFTLASGRVRPQLDHFFPKNIYPYLALSLYNMVPSCSTCNMAQSVLDTQIKPILYPFDEEFGYAAQFNIRMERTGNFAQIMQGISDQFVIQLDDTSHPKEAAINEQWKSLHLEELYTEHKEYVMDILKSKYVNTSKRINEIRKTFPKLFNSDGEVKNMLYMTDIRKECWGKRPLSKLTHDIDQQLDSKGICYI